MYRDRKRFFFPAFAPLGEDGLEVAFEEARAFWRFFSALALAGGDALKCFVEDANNPPLPRGVEEG